MRSKAPPLLYSSERTLTLVFGDACAFLLATFLASVIIVHAWNADLNYGRVLISALVGALVCILIFNRLGLYRVSFAQNVRDEFYYVVTALCLTIVPQVAVFSFFPSISTSRAVLLVTLVLAVTLVGTFRAMSHALLDTPHHRRPHRVVVVGESDDALALDASLRSVERVETMRLREQSLPADSIEAALRWGADRIVFSGVPEKDSIAQIMDLAKRAKIAVAFAAPRISVNGFALSLEQIGDQPLVVPRPKRACTIHARFFKRTIDVCFAAVATAIAFPIMACVAAAIWFEDRGEILFRQERIGQNGRPFMMLKFRSMRREAEASSGPTWAKAGDGRVTRIGAILRRTSLDELPQLFNVLRGEMSIVGPRPERPFFVQMFRLTLPHYDERHVVKPGITGWSQVHMKRVLEPSAAGEKLAFDLFYIEHWSVFMDISVICKTAAEFLFHRAV
ncbi:MAG: sugar transferase [Candidatus Eremiobacteraeota bacterium]|nr:sugar transferase [Candidatus Eremiobacteraeota bacterium]